MEPHGQADVRQEEVKHDRLLGVHVGVDLGVTYDWTAVVVAQVRERMRSNAPDRLDGSLRKETYYVVQEVRRWPHNLAAPEIATGLRELFLLIREQMIKELESGVIHGFDKSGQLPPRAVYIDATGLGKGIMPSIQQVLGDYRETADVDIHPMTFVHGEKYDPFHWDYLQGWSVGKTHLITNLQALLHSDRLDLPKNDPQSPDLRQEIDAFQFAIDRNGSETFAGKGAHDDLVMALALCCLDDPRQFQVTVQTFTY